MRSQAESSGIKLSEVHGVEKGLDLNTLQEKQVMKPIAVTKVKDMSQIKLRLSPGRAGFRCKIKIPEPLLISKPIAQQGKTNRAAQMIQYSKLIEYKIILYQYQITQFLI